MATEYQPHPGDCPGGHHDEVTPQEVVAAPTVTVTWSGQCSVVTRRVILAQVEGDTLRQYSQLLCTGTAEIKAGDN